MDYETHIIFIDGGSHPFVYGTEKPVNPDVYYARRATLFDLLPVYSSDIIMLGNSLTDGAEWNELFDNCHVKNRGIVGDIIPGFFERLEPILKGQPRKIFIMGGVNDISHGVSADSIVSAMTQVVTTIQARCPKLRFMCKACCHSTTMFAFGNF